MNKISNKTMNKVKTIMRVTTLFSFLLNTIPAVYAAEDPIGVINNLSSFIFSLTRAIGTIILVYGVIQIGLSFQTHDPSQKSNGIFTLVGGLIIAFAKEIIGLITG